MNQDRERSLDSRTPTLEDEDNMRETQRDTCKTSPDVLLRIQGMKSEPLKWHGNVIDLLIIAISQAIRTEANAFFKPRQAFYFPISPKIRRRKPPKTRQTDRSTHILVMQVVFFFSL